MTFLQWTVRIHQNLSMPSEFQRFQFSFGKDANLCRGLFCRCRRWAWRPQQKYHSELEHSGTSVPKVSDASWFSMILDASIEFDYRVFLFGVLDISLCICVTLSYFLALLTFASCRPSLPGRQRVELPQLLHFSECWLSGAAISQALKLQRAVTCSNTVYLTISARSWHVEGRNWLQYRPDFNGMWSCFEIVGDMDALLVSLEVGWAKRHLAILVSLMFWAVEHGLMKPIP